MGAEADMSTRMTGGVETLEPELTMLKRNKAARFNNNSNNV